MGAHLQDCFINCFQERLSLSFGRVEWTYIDIDPNTNRPRGEVKAGWDVAANRPM